MEKNKNKSLFKNEVGLEAIIFIVVFMAFFCYMGSIMGGTNMIKTMMSTGFDLLMNVCFYLMAVAVLAGGVSGLFSEFGVIALINKVLSKVMGPLYDLPGASSLGMLNCYILTIQQYLLLLTMTTSDNILKSIKCQLLQI